MAEHLSDQETKHASGKTMKTNEITGTQRVAFFSFTVPEGNAAISDVVKLTHLPKGARILGGEMTFEAMSTGAAAASVTIGIDGATDKYLALASVDAAGKLSFADTIATNFGDELATNVDILATVKTEAWAAGKTLKGFITYVQD